METPLRLAIDLDGTIHNPKDKLPGYKMGRPIAGAPMALKQLHDEGAIIVIHSVWADTEQKCQAIAEWCKYFRVPYDFITNKKPVCDYYIDDHGYRFENWKDTLDFINIQNLENQIQK